MTTSKELSESIDKFGATALAIKAERDRLKESHAELLAALKLASGHYCRLACPGENSEHKLFCHQLAAQIEKAGNL